MRIAIVLILIFLVACSGNRVSRESQSFVQRDAQSPLEKQSEKKISIISAGEFNYNTHHIAGTAAYAEQEGKRVLLLQNFQIEAKQNLRIILKTQNDAEISVGPPPGYVGNYTIIIPQTIDLNEYTIIALKSDDNILAIAELS